MKNLAIMPIVRKLLLVNLRYVILGILVALLVSYGYTSILDYWKGNHDVDSSTVVEGVHQGDNFVMASSSPTRLKIPKIGIDVPFSEPLGLTIDGASEVPEAYDNVGWYRFGPTPGAVGPAVVLGHVDSYLGPAVFFSLGQLDSGNLIHVDREDGSTATFVVTKLARSSQDDFPTMEVYGDLPYAGLRLITCSGQYDKKIKRYSHNLIVYATLVEPNPL